MGERIILLSKGKKTLTILYYHCKISACGLPGTLKGLPRQFPALVVTGPRQVGKTALVRKVFPNADYVFLDLPSIASQAETVPKEFLQPYRNPLIIGEVQYAPSLFRYLKVMIDKDRRPGRFILTGSQNFLLMQGISGSLAGRYGVLNILILSATELNMEENPFPKTSKSGLFYPDQRGLRNFFSEEQMEKIVETSPEWLRSLILTSYFPGLREGELLGLRWEWIDIKDGIIYLPSTKTLKDSTGRGQRVVMQKELIDWFKGLQNRSEENYFPR